MLRFKKLTFCFVAILLMAFNPGQSQNLVSNGSFESYTSCPSDFNQITKTNGWTNPSAGTPDYFNACATSCFFSVPSTLYGYQTAHSGLAFAGFISNSGFSTSLHWTEYIQNQLTDSLTRGKEYKFAMYLNLADKSGIASNKIGVYFSDSAISSNTQEFLNFTPPIITTGFITDKNNWTKVTGTYTARGGEKYILIGNFTSKFSNNTTQPVFGGGGWDSLANWPLTSYYFIDDVSLVDCSYLPPDLLGNDTTLCSNWGHFSLPLSAYTPFNVNYLWSTGDTTPSIIVDRSDNYWVYITRGECEYLDSISVKIFGNPVINLGNDQKICKETTLTLDAKNKGSVYLWNDQSTSQTLKVKAPGLFFVKVTSSQGCSAVDSIGLDTLPSPFVYLGNDSSFCEGTTCRINAGTQFKSYLWQDASTNNFYPVKNAGTYFVTVKDFNNCIASDSVQLSVKPKPFIDISSNIKVCEPDLFIKTSRNFVSYLWQDGSTSSNFHVTDYGNYSLTVTDSNQCSTTQQIQVVSNCPGMLFVPNAFTPNGDGKNETFFPVGRNIKTLNFEIYNRWGELLFETSEINKGWDGTFQNNFVQPGVYFYKIIYTGMNEEVTLLKGNVTLVK
ncbi:MAG: gliding motility-associated C-terminal domain-containing protein [Bacteroidia bacterium]